MTNSFERDKDSILDYTVDWSSWLGEGETIASHSLIVTPTAGLTVDQDTHTDTAVTYWVSGGTVGSVVKVTCRVVTNQNRTDDRTVEFVTGER